ncbi:MAG: class I SAM-dependent methyltransferase [Syntrophorhabdaceae bacterium]|nr:class I SAM-dependent methyltransferase [Syntrophorhabdaceae bacterium]
MKKGKPSPYYYSTREDMIRLIPKGVKKILEVGCAGGMTGKRLKEMGFDVVGIEIIEDIAMDGAPYYERIIIGDVEKIDLPFERGYFDCIMYGDVLEHLVDPWGLIKKQNPFLKMGGVAISSIPNIRHYRIIKKLTIKGEWEYTEDGIMDKTHLRFFTIKSIKRLFGDGGFEIKEVIKRPSGAKWLKTINSLTGNRLIDFLVRQYIFSSVKVREV